MSTQLSPFRVWTPSGKSNLDFVSELSNVEKSQTLAAQSHDLTFFHPGLGHTRLASASLWRVPANAVRSLALKDWLVKHSPDASVLNLFGATHYLGCGHLGVDSMLGHITGLSGLEDRAQRRALHVWSGEMRVETDSIHVNMTSRHGFEVNTAQKKNTTKLPKEVASLLKKVAATRSVVSHDYDPAEKHFAAMPPGHDPRHSDLESAKFILMVGLSDDRNKPDVNLYAKDFWEKCIPYFNAAKVLMAQDPSLYGSPLSQAVDRIITNLSAAYDLADEDDRRVPYDPTIIELYTQLCAELSLWCHYQETVVAEQPTDTENEKPTPPSPHKMFDVVLVPETRFANFWRRWVG